ncbi:universal stress protein [Saccharicrinis sp. 156]|uniref:universal stress protein n=1 Tax=Saccharicrinis sp. 156 TaxID=3417574 RepID=UPI003D3489B2
MIRFLIPVNFAPYTLKAIEYCTAIAEHVGGEITLLYCYTNFLSESDGESDSETDSGNEKSETTILSHQDAYTELEKLKAHVLSNTRRSNNLQIKLRVLDGYPEDAIQLFCKEYYPDLIVMGTKSKGETIKELLGSVTLDIIKGVSFPVMAVPINYSFNLDKINNILFVTDFAKCEYTSLHKLVRLVGTFKTKIHNVQYCPAGKEKVDAEQLKEYSEYCKSTYRNQSMICDYICGHDMVAASMEYIENNNIDLMAITRKKRNFIAKMMHPSQTRKILFSAEIPTLFFHK